VTQTAGIQLLSPGNGLALSKLRAALEDAALLGTLNDACCNWGPDAAAVSNYEVARAFPLRTGGFVLDLQTHLADGSKLDCLVEIPATHLVPHLATFETRKAKQAIRLGGFGLRASALHADHALGLTVRPKGQDELIDGLAVFNQAGKTSGKLQVTGLLAHRLHRRAVVAATLYDEVEAIIKLYKRSSGKAERAIAVAAMLRESFAPSKGKISVAGILSFAMPWPGFCMAKSPGVAANALTGKLRKEAIAAAGHALSALHQVDQQLCPPHLASDEVALLADWVAHAKAVFPNHSRQLREAFEQCKAMLLQCKPERLALIHRDFHEGQVLTDGETATMLDFDTAATGDPAQDIGNFLAHLDFAAIMAGRTSSEETDVFLGAYGSSHRQRTAAHRSATLLRLACIYSFSTQHRRHVKALLALAGSTS
jgi:aminoglycoside phosphotransferase